MGRQLFCRGKMPLPRLFGLPLFAGSAFSGNGSAAFLSRQDAAPTVVRAPTVCGIGVQRQWVGSFSVAARCRSYGCLFWFPLFGGSAFSGNGSAAFLSRQDAAPTVVCLGRPSVAARCRSRLTRFGRYDCISVGAASSRDSRPRSAMPDQGSGGGSKAFDRNSEFRNSLFVPYQMARKFGSSANRMTLPAPLRSAIIAAVPSSAAWLVSDA